MKKVNLAADSLFRSSRNKLLLAIRLNWATNRSWNSYSFRVPVGFRYRVTSQNNTGQYFKWRNEGFGVAASLECEISVWNSWHASNIFDLHGRWAIKGIEKSTLETRGEIIQTKTFLHAGRVTAVDFYLLFSLALLTIFKGGGRRAFFAIRLCTVQVRDILSRHSSAAQQLNPSWL